MAIGSEAPKGSDPATDEDLLAPPKRPPDFARPPDFPNDFERSFGCPLQKNHQSIYLNGWLKLLVTTDFAKDLLLTFWSFLLQGVIMSSVGEVNGTFFCSASFCWRSWRCISRVLGARAFCAWCNAWMAGEGSAELAWLASLETGVPGADIVVSLMTVEIVCEK